MGNQTILNELFFSGLSDVPGLQFPLFLFFLLIYLLTSIWNLLIIVLIVTDSHLHVPMYFFLGNLAGLDLCYSSVTVPRMLFDLHTKTRKISIRACITQVFFFIFFMGCEAFLLAVMSYDRYIAICQPLHYTQVMLWKVCIQLVSIVCCLSFTNSLIHTLSAFSLTFCKSNIIESFLCDLPQLFRLSCSDMFISILLIFLSTLSLGVAAFSVTFLSYVYVFKTIVGIKMKDGRLKAFSTCSSHLTVVSIYYVTSFFNYFQPQAKNFLAGRLVSVVCRLLSLFYTVVTPLLNPIIYSLRNTDLKRALQKALSGKGFIP
ncbi:unnamed protein product [Staurois parvus]|uniref:Olfactory receptor n=1 Tax=Staurois parvus TaxID=386267 RepID=A0ABN9GP95_9NEOB|nr:unnamed protein product [Staurois parvus]